MTLEQRATALATVSALAAAWIVFALLVWLYGESPASVAADLARGTWGSAYGIGQVLFKATPLLFTGLAVALALRAGLFNIGAEGQLAVAGLAAAAVGVHLPAGTSVVIALPVVVITAFAAGALWATIPAILRAGFGAHEVISTIMLNRIADAAVGLALGAGLARAGTVRTEDVAPGARFPALSTLPWLSSLEGSAASSAIVFALLVLALFALALQHTVVGRETVLVGQNAVASAANGVPAKRRLAVALVVSGGVAGLACTATVLGDKGHFETGLGAGAGFAGIAVALLARQSLPAIPLAALLFGTLQQGGFVINKRVPMEIADVTEAVVIAAVALFDTQVRKALLRAVRRKDPAS